MYVPKAGSLHMLSKSQTWTLDAGQTVHLECEFIADEFNLFDNPIVWRKRQHRPVTWSPSSTPTPTPTTTSSNHRAASSMPELNPIIDFNDPYLLSDPDDDDDDQPLEVATVMTSSMTSLPSPDDDANSEEETQINMMGNLVEPFASAKRFKATFNSQSTKAPSYLFGLTISRKSTVFKHAVIFSIQIS